MKYSFFMPKIETRSIEVDGLPVYIVKGYAATPNTVYPYKTYEDRTFNEFFTDKAIESIKRKAKSKKVFVDAEHGIATKNNSKKFIENMKAKLGTEFQEELDYIDRSFKYSDIPMFKVEDINIDEKGLFVEIRGNPFYRDIDAEHKTYFDSIWGSLENGFINGMSLNFKPTKDGIIEVEEGLSKIDDVDIYGISLTGSPSNDMATITEVAMRSMENLRGEAPCQKKSLRLKML